MRSLILFLTFIIPWLLVILTACTTVYAIIILNDKDLVAPSAAIFGLVLLVACPSTFVVLTSFDDEYWTKKDE